jgi:phosphatidylglycerophosphatase GEP4
MPSNLSAFTLFFSTLSKSPTTLLPNLTVPTLLHLPEDIGPHLKPQTTTTTDEKPLIRALVLDKDNTFTAPKSPHIPSPYFEKLKELRTSPTSPFNLHSNPDSVLVVSNTAGSSERYESHARDLEARLAELKIPVFRQQGKRKPFCGKEVMGWFLERGVVKSGREVGVVGDRLGTDVLMAGEMGAWSIWVRDGVVVEKDGGKNGEVTDYRGWLAKGEVFLERYLREGGGLGPKAPGERDL